jgi:hypothetical protein
MILKYTDYKQLLEYRNVDTSNPLNVAMDQSLSISGYNMQVAKIQNAYKDHIDNLSLSVDDKPEFLVENFKILKVYEDFYKTDIIIHISFTIDNYEYIGAFKNILNSTDIPLLECEIFNKINMFKDFRFRFTLMMYQELLENLKPAIGKWIVSYPNIYVTDINGNRLLLKKNLVFDVSSVNMINKTITIEVFSKTYTISGKNFWLFKKYLKQF